MIDKLNILSCQSEYVEMEEQMLALIVRFSILCILEFSQVGSDEVGDAWHNEQGLGIEVAGAPVITRQPIITLASKSAGGSVFFWA